MPILKASLLAHHPCSIGLQGIQNRFGFGIASAEHNMHMVAAGREGMKLPAAKIASLPYRLLRNEALLCIQTYKRLLHRYSAARLEGCIGRQKRGSK